MEELFEFMQEAREMDRKIELEHATEEGIMITIKNYIKSCKEKPTAATLAAIFDVKESFVQPLL
jgi:DNA helicase IV